ncbi:hypothetical protein SCP_0506100 [Sparassis crispa]|uniref:Uncharacterized protein n=1 Tax=Sparassis crispa TaxID=139825 RepID=A0A401GMW7_9APHY|nr:hypothetical protein SCP_0506100 [Sparassis crispa]GBE83555.1 hypothetical protein SCP_0506100 [Sparassis crispa]
MDRSLRRVHGLCSLVRCHEYIWCLPGLLLIDTFDKVVVIHDLAHWSDPDIPAVQGWSGRGQDLQRVWNYRYHRCGLVSDSVLSYDGVFSSGKPTILAVSITKNPLRYGHSSDLQSRYDRRRPLVPSQEGLRDGLAGRPPATLLEV